MSDVINLDDEATQFSLNGGTTPFQAAVGQPVVRNFGWQPTPPGEAALIAQAFTTDSVPARLKGDRVFLWDYLRLANREKFPPLNWQLTGSCVNGGFFNAFRVLQAIDCVLSGKAAAFVEPFTLAVYGQSRSDFNPQSPMWNNEGEGSFGLLMARAATRIGVAPGDLPEVSRPHVCGPAVVFDRPVELRWSSVRNHPSTLREKSAKYTLKFTRVTTADEATAELRRCRPLTWAGSWGGKARAETRGNQFRVLFMPRQDVWQHQQSCLGYWKHPELGDLWYIQNQWYVPTSDMRVEYIRIGTDTYINRITQAGNARPMHGEHPKIEGVGEFPPGGYWIDRQSMESQCRTGEVCSLFSSTGYDGRPLDFSNL